MTQYLTRVELHNEQPADYPKLHAEMEARNFTRQVMLNGVWYHLPHATYLSHSNSDRNFVFGLARAAVVATGRSAGIIVVAVTNDGVLGGGLKPVQ